MCKVSDKKLWIIDWTDLGGDSGAMIKPIPGMLNEFVNRCELATGHQPPGLGYTLYPALYQWRFLSLLLHILVRICQLLYIFVPILPFSRPRL